MAQSIKKVGDSALQILFKPGTYRYSNHDYNNDKTLNRSVCLSRHKITSELLEDKKKLLILNGINHYQYGSDIRSYYWGIKSGLQKLYLDSTEGTNDANLTLLNGLYSISNKWKEQKSNKILFLCSHVVNLCVFHHSNAMYEIVLISSLSQELVNQLSARAIARATE